MLNFFFDLVSFSCVFAFSRSWRRFKDFLDGAKWHWTEIARAFDKDGLRLAVFLHYDARHDRGDDTRPVLGYELLGLVHFFAIFLITSAGTSTAATVAAGVDERIFANGQVKRSCDVDYGLGKFLHLIFNNK